MKFRFPEDNSFLNGNPNAPEHEIFEIITILMGAASRIRTTYYQMNVIHAAMIDAEPTEGIGQYMKDQARSVIWEKQLVYQVLTSIPHSDEHDLF